MFSIDKNAAENNPQILEEKKMCDRHSVWQHPSSIRAHPIEQILTRIDRFIVVYSSHMHTYIHGVISIQI